MSATSWIWDNKEWLFSGLGLVVILAFLRWIKQTSKPTSLATDPLSDLMLGTRSAPLPAPHWFWRLLQLIPGLRPLAWRKIYSDERLDQEIRIGARGDGGGIELYRDGDNGRAQVWLDVVNLAPFPIEIDRITGDLTVAGVAVAQINAVDRHTISAKRWGDVYVQFPLSAGQLDAVTLQLKHRPDAKAGLRIRVYLESGIRNVGLTRQFESGNCRFTNFHIT